MSTVAAPGLLRRSHTKLKSPWSPPVEEIGMRSKVRKDAEKDALRLLRATFRYRVPVESAAIANDLGIQVLDLELNENTLGALLVKPGEDPKIVLNERHSVLRRRLTCAMEVAHYLRQSADTNRYRRVDRRETSPGDPEALYAREFASCLLMPKLEVEVFAELGMDDLDMAMRFLVPREAMQLRLQGLRLGSPDLELF